ncbi:MotA/TolQ/ExbB proton channel family protein [Massilia sp. MB5]|uniref:MotA/TolQ/ExbB proton channel family protein n=1 Tax=Massilia sp. MB5 TaxID=2919578 RepID=UPI001F0DEAB1|nr:MotA/TolQ/ExbB proton channel family protein [Massilia sp. MB5]UMR32021.1 MotA/TolQ/ExbB proton channel family protein [Massilia sp. MB5]
MQILIETLMYQLGQIFLLPTLALIALLFLYSCYSLGGFAVQALQRRRGQGRPLLEWWRSNRHANADELDVRAHKQLEAARIATRIAPMLGLVATMIPMGPAMKSLSDGNLGAVSQNLMVAFSAVILALIAASATFLVVNVRRRWLAEEILEIDSLREEKTQ